MRHNLCRKQIHEDEFDFHLMKTQSIVMKMF